MGWIGDNIESIPSIQISHLLTRIVSLGIIVTSALIIWKELMCVTGSESPFVVILSGSIESGFKRGDILFLHMSKDPIRTGEIVVSNVHRFITGMLTNIGSLTLDKIHNNLKMFYAAEPSYDKSLQQLQSFMSGLIVEEKIEFRDGLYFVKK